MSVITSVAFIEASIHLVSAIGVNVLGVFSWVYLYNFCLRSMARTLISHSRLSGVAMVDVCGV